MPPSLERALRDAAHLEVLDDDGERGREERDLALGRAEAEQLLHDGLKLWAQQLVGLVHDKGRALAQVGDALAGEVEDPAGRADEDVDRLGQAHDVVLERRSARRDHDVDAEVLAERLGHLRRLERKLPRRHEQQSLDLGPLRVELLERRDDEGRRLAGAVLGLTGASRSGTHMARAKGRDGDKISRLPTLAKDVGRRQDRHVPGRGRPVR
jgi:hypothetical protein